MKQLPLVLLLLAGTACAPTQPAAAPPMTASARPAAMQPSEEDRRLNEFLDRAFDEQVALSPQQLTSLGIKTDYDKLDDYTDAGAARELALAEAQLAAMRREFDPERLSPAGQSSFRLFEAAVAQQRLNDKWRSHAFPVTNNGSVMGGVPVFMANQHRIDTVADAEAYIARLVEVERVMGEVAARIRAQAAAGIVPPKFVFDPVTNDGRRVITGAPFTDGADSVVLADFKRKVEALDASAAEKARLTQQAEAALTGPFKRGYESLLAAVEEVEPRATSNDGAWRLPQGEAYYADRLRFYTTTGMTADQIHEKGLAEVERIQAEMEAIKAKVGFEGTLQEFFRHITGGQQFKYPNTEAGREAYLTDARGFIAQVMQASPRYFHRLPEAELEVRAVEKFREATAAVAFYNDPAPDGSRPGIYYVNLADMTQVLKPQIEAISYHEGAPGHHFQNAFAQEMDALPKFRRYGFGYGAYGEGWGLYAERLGKEMGFYDDPYSDFGRLSTELWRAVRMVTDTGLHSKRWSRERAMQYFRDNSLLSERDIQKEVERYIVNPGQATSYKVGQLKILELREKARTALGERFDIRDFHQVVLGGGSVPLDVLERQVDAYIAAKGA